MKKLNKKGFTIVELVIVIAVIAILAAVLIPTFSGVVDKANKSSAMQAAKSEYTLYLTEHADEVSDKMDLDIVVRKGDVTYVFEVTNGQFNAEGKVDNSYSSVGKDDLTKLKSEEITVEPGDWSANYQNYYSDEECTTKITTTGGVAPAFSACYKIVRNAIEGQNPDVAIYKAADR